MRLNIIFSYDVDTTTGEMKFLGKEEVTVDTTVEAPKKKASATKTTKKVDNNPDPIITLDSNKLILTQGAVDLLQVCEDCRIDIKYKKKDKKTYPVIATDQVFKTKGGNKLTKSNTVSYRGAANEKLAAYGTVFKLEPTEDEGIYYLVGDKEPEEMKVPDEITNIESELDIDILDELDIDTSEEELIDFKFEL